MSNLPPILITFASPKGGVGKSTACLSMAGALAARGAPVHIIDLDQTGTLIRWYQHHGAKVAGVTVETIAEAKLFEHLTALCRNPTRTGYIFLDLAGALSVTMLQAAAIAHLTITPARLSEPDIIEATKLHYQLGQIGTGQGRAIAHRVVINSAPALLATYQRHALDQLANSPLRHFATLMHERAPYAEQFLTGQPPHYADQQRPPVQKAVAELDALIDELIDVLSQSQQAIAA